MSLQPCQLDAYVERGWSEVHSCAERPDGLFDVVVDASVLYPEGGGQPADRGTVAGVAVVDVQKAPSGEVLLTTAGSVDPGRVEVVVDMVRRFDHMQQHTAQHLITAIAQDRFGRATQSFHLGAELCSIELDGPVPAPMLHALEDAANAEIRANRAVRHRLVSLEEYASAGARSRGLPEGFAGEVRLVEIDGLDVNTCGGTHVSRLGELQLIHLTGVEKSRGGVRLSYVAGGRALERLRTDTARTRSLNRALKCGPETHLEQVERLLDAAKADARQRRQLLGELATALGESLAKGANTDATHLHHPVAELGFLQGIADAARGAGLTGPLLLTGGTGQGVFLLDADPEQVAAVGPRVAEALEGRGGGRGRRFQGKAQQLQAASAQLLR